MFHQFVPKLQQSARSTMGLRDNAGRVGWCLDGRRALSFKAPRGGVLRVERGRIWATADGPHSGPLNDWGDVVLASGGQWHLSAGQRVVIEPWVAQSQDAALISWEPGP